MICAADPREAGAEALGSEGSPGPREEERSYLRDFGGRCRRTERARGGMQEELIGQARKEIGRDSSGAEKFVFERRGDKADWVKIQDVAQRVLGRRPAAGLLTWKRTQLFHDPSALRDVSHVTGVREDGRIAARFLSRAVVRLF